MNRNLLFYIILCLLNTTGTIPIAAQLSTRSVQGNSTGLCCPEIAYVHTDRDLYVAGENMFFKLYVTPDRILKTGQISSVGYMVLRDQKTNIINLILKLKAGSSFGCVHLPDTLKSGVYELVAFTNHMKNYGESIFFRKELLIVNRFDKMLDNLYAKDSAGMDWKPQPRRGSVITNSTANTMNLVPEKDSFKIREKIRIDIRWNDKSLIQGLVNASVSVKAITPITTIPIEPILVVSDTMIGIGGSSGAGNYDLYFAEEKGIYIKGQITSADNQPLNNECLFISTIDTLANLQYTFSNEQGKFLLLLDNYYMGKNIVLKPWEYASQNSNKKIELEDKFSLHTSFRPHMPDMSINLKKYIFSSQDLVQINKTYRTDENMLHEPVSKNEKIVFPFVFFQPGSIVYPANFIPLDNFEEISANILFGFVLRKNNDVYNIFLFDNLTKSFFTRPALIFVDGMLIDNASQIINLNSDDIKKIELCNSLRMKGELEFPGIVSIITKKRLPDYIRYNSSAIKFKINAYTPKSYYQPPEYEKNSSTSYLPDFRQLLYWNPEFKLKSGESNFVEFYSSDYLSEYLVEVRGITSDGKPVSAYTKIKVYR